ncbi:MAG: hypothetical protein PHP89_06435, partial [Candidatus Omnitrophica bacterium]|nr:hypothetical protein [Candidatus Omnitrophota bacterium]
MTVQKNGREVFNDSDINNPDIDGGTIDNATIAGGSITGITDLVVADGGTGASTLTDHGVLLGSGTDPITALGAMTNGQLVIGSTGADPVVASITDGEGITTTAGAGTLTIACEDASTSNKGVTVYSGSTKALAGTDTASAMTPADVKTVVDARLPTENLIGVPGQIGFGVGICPPANLPPGMVGMPGYDQLGSDNYGNYVFSDGSIMIWVPRFYYRV